MMQYNGLGKKKVVHDIAPESLREKFLDFVRRCESGKYSHNLLTLVANSLSKITRALLYFRFEFKYY